MEGVGETENNNDDIYEDAVSRPLRSLDPSIKKLNMLTMENLLPF